VRRYQAFDPPEYVDWQADPDLVSEFASRLTIRPDEARHLGSLDEEWFLDLYRDLLRARLLDIGLKRWVRQGIVSKAWLGTGEEAVTVGAVSALYRDRDVVIPMIRNAASCFMMGMPISDLFRGYLATPDAPGEGRDLHIGAADLGVIQPISHMGTNVPVITGIALSFQLKGEDRVGLTWIGDGATRTGECHEGLNLAAVRNVPAVFVLQDNQVALGTRRDEHARGDLAHWAAMYGIPNRTVDGNNVLEVHLAVREAARACRTGDGPRMILARTFRMGGHATHDEREARDLFPESIFRDWGRRDPVGLFESYLTARGIGEGALQEVEEEVVAEVDEAAEEALKSRSLTSEGVTALYEGVSEGPPTVGIPPIQDE
jgi:2-oxoisovalerate dehydrogenase E1 component